MNTVSVFKGDWLECQEDENNILQVVFSSKNSSVNKFNQATLSELRQVIDLILEKKDKKGVLFSSSKSVFIVGADITEFLPLFKQPKEELQGWLEETHKLFNDIEDLDVPTVVAINGICLGGGFEFCLASAYRVASEKAILGLPEVKLGIYPGWGGTIRLPRLIGADNAIEWIAAGGQHKAPQAMTIGAVDMVVSSGSLQECSYKLLQEAVQGKLDWKARQEEKRSPLQFISPVESVMCFETAKAFVAQKAGSHYPAPLKAVAAMQQTAFAKRKDALKVEIAGFIEVAKTPVAENLVGIFLADQFNKRSNKAQTQEQTPVQYSCVVGAGIMGGGIAYQSAMSKVPITMKDINQEALNLGLTEATSLLTKLHKIKKIDANKMTKVMSQITPTLSYGDFKQADIVVEAVVENISVKKSVLTDIEANTRENAVIATNTSTISIDDLAQDLSRPENFCGMHFFNPVHKMPLVEIIKGKNTSSSTISKVVQYALQMKKVPVIVNNCPGFLVNRVLFPYFYGLMELLREGASLMLIDKTMENFGWPMGPCYLLDVIGIDTAYHASSVMAKAYPDRMSSDKPSLLKLFLDNKRLGQKNKKGFYQYELNKKGKLQKNFDQNCQELLSTFVSSVKEVDENEIIDRMMIPLITESARCLEEKIVATPMEVDLGAIYGLGFPPFRGGILKYADSIGLGAVCEKISQYSSLGGCYEAPAILQNLAKEEKTFYPQV